MAENNTDSTLYNVYAIVDILDKDHNVIQSVNTERVDVVNSHNKVTFNVDIDANLPAILRVRTLNYTLQ